jgi:hypothetical protein
VLLETELKFIRKIFLEHKKTQANVWMTISHAVTKINHRHRKREQGYGPTGKVYRRQQNKVVYSMNGGTHNGSQDSKHTDLYNKHKEKMN